MAETAVLIIFVLLLMLTVLLGREADRRRDVEQGLERYEELRLLLVERGHDPDAFLDTVRTHRDNWRELVRLDEALDDAGIESTPETMTQLAEVVQAGREAGLATDEMRDAITVYEAIDDALRGRGEEPAPHSLEKIVRDAERWREHAGADSEDLAAELDRANERIERLQAQAQGGGGTDHPSCWYNDDGTVAYLFDVAMNAEGYVIQPARAPQHERKRASLPLSHGSEPGGSWTPNSFWTRRRRSTTGVSERNAGSSSGRSISPHWTRRSFTSSACEFWSRASTRMRTHPGRRPPKTRQPFARPRNGADGR